MQTNQRRRKNETKTASSHVTSRSHLSEAARSAPFLSEVTIKIEQQTFFQQFWSGSFSQNWGKMIDLTSKLEEINDIEHNKGSKTYPQNQVILDCIMPSIALMHKCLSIILMWVIVSHK